LRLGAGTDAGDLVAGGGNALIERDRLRTSLLDLAG
jgi:hypothetical protein